MNMKRMLLIAMMAGTCLMMLNGCAASKKTYERGWIGGEYLEASNSLFKRITSNYFKSNSGVVPALPDAIGNGQKSAVLVSRVFDHTPLGRAGVRDGDLIFAINREKVVDIGSLREIVDKGKPGGTLLLTVYRNGEKMVLPVVVGRETYQRWGYFSLGFRLAPEFEPIPTPDFNIFGLASFERNQTRLELNSPEYRYYEKAHPCPPGKSERTPNSAADAEGWDAWFIIFGLSGKTIVLNQQS